MKNMVQNPLAFKRNKTNADERGSIFLPRNKKGGN